MTAEEKNKFIYNVSSVIESNPDLLQPVIVAATNGANKAIKNAEQYAMDMETLASVYHAQLDTRYKEKTKQYIDRITEDKFEKNKKFLRLVWDRS